MSESFQIRLSQQSGGDSEDLTINKVFNQKTIANKSVIVVDAMTTSLEDSIYQIEHTNVSILYEIVPEMIELLPDQTSMEFIWFTIIGNSSDEVVKIYEEIQQSNSNEIFAMHTNEWQQFWKQNKISVDSDIELAKTIQSSLYALASSLPSLNTSQPRSIFYGLSPSGLGLGKLLTDYQGQKKKKKLLFVRFYFVFFFFFSIQAIHFGTQKYGCIQRFYLSNPVGAKNY